MPLFMPSLVEWRIHSNDGSRRQGKGLLPVASPEGSPPACRFDDRMGCEFPYIQVDLTIYAALVELLTSLFLIDYMQLLEPH